MDTSSQSLRMSMTATVAAAILLHLTAAAVAEPPQPALEQAPAMDVPLVLGLEIDGQLSDWADDGLDPIRLAPSLGAQPAPDDFAVSARLAWDGRGLAVLIRVADNRLLESPHKATLDEQDSVDLFLADRVGGENLLRVTIAPGLDPAQSALRMRTWNYRSDDAQRQSPLHVAAASTRTEDGYIVEVLLPWDSIGVRPGSGREVALQIQAHDADDPHRRQTLRWHPGVDPVDHRNHLQRLLLTPMRHELALDTDAQGCGT